MVYGNSACKNIIIVTLIGNFNLSAFNISLTIIYYACMHAYSKYVSAWVGILPHYNYKQGAHFARPLLHLFCIYITSCSYTHCMQYHVSTAVKGQTLLLRRGHSLIKESSRACRALIILYYVAAHA